MTSPERPRPAPDLEEVWDHLRAAMDLNAGAWLGLVLGAEAPDLDELIERTRAVARRRVRRVEVLSLVEQTTSAVLGRLLDEPTDDRAATWVRGPGIERRTEWVAFLRRLNERRDALWARHHGAVLLALPAGEAMALVRDEAPDLWSFRGLTVSLPPARRPVDALVSGTAMSVGPAPSFPTPALDEPVHPRPAVADPLRLAASALRSGRFDFALDHVAAAEEASVDVVDDAWVLAWRARARDAQGEPDEAVRLALDALHTRRPLDTDTADALLTLLRRLAAPPVAHDAAAALVDRYRQATRQAPDNVEATRDLAGALLYVGELDRVRGRLEAAGAAFGESLMLARRLVETVGETPETLRDLSVSLDRLGEVDRDQGRLEAAGAAFGESLALRRRLVEVVGETPETLRDVSVSLDRVGDVDRDQGRLEAAGAAYGESLVLARRAVEVVGETPETLRDVSVSLDRLGEVDRVQGRLEAAGAVFGESLVLARRLVEVVGETPETLRDLVVTLSRVALTRRDLDDGPGARDAATEALDRHEQSIERFGLAPRDEDRGHDLRRLLADLDDERRSSSNT